MCARCHGYERLVVLVPCRALALQESPSPKFTSFKFCNFMKIGLARSSKLY